MNGTLEEPCKDGDGSFMFTSESVGEGHPGEYGTLLGVVSPLSSVGWGGTHRGMRGVWWLRTAQRGECELEFCWDTAALLNREGILELGLCKRCVPGKKKGCFRIIKQIMHGGERMQERRAWEVRVRLGLLTKASYHCSLGCSP